MLDLEPLLKIALDLTSSLAASDRYARLLAAVRSAIPCDSAALLRLDGDRLVPLATYGLAPEVLGRDFPRRDHPRLDTILDSRTPVLFPPDSSLPDPFDGLLAADTSSTEPVHACLGCPLIVADQVMGVLAADALEPGAFDSLDRDLLATLGALAGAALQTTQLIEALEEAAAQQTRVARELQRTAAERSGSQLIGTSPPMEKIRREIEVVCSSAFTVLITGETGVGKEVVARCIHDGSRRAEAPLIYVNCAAMPEALAESELFGHVRGSFSGATADRAGKFEVADGGTLFLDEIGELPLGVQAKLLRVLQDGEIQRVGSDRPRRVDVRLLAATNRNLKQEVEGGRFRLDLFHRLGAFPIHVPPLRERAGDIPLLAGHFLESHRRRLGLGPLTLSDAARHHLQSLEWRGNVRELENLLGRAALRAGSLSEAGKAVRIDPEHLGMDSGPALPRPEAEPVPPGAKPPTLQLALDQVRRDLITGSVNRHGGNWAAAARELGMHRGNLHHLARRLGLK